VSAADVVFRLEADVGQAVEALARAQKAIEGMGEAGEQTGKRLTSALSADIGDVFDGLGARFDAATGGMIRFSTVMGGVKIAAGIAAAGVAGVGAAVAFGMREAAEAEEVHRRLVAALESQGAATIGNIAALDDFADSLANTSRFGDEAARSAMAMGLSLGVPTTKIREFTQAAADLAAGRGLQIEDAARMLGQTFDGTVGRVGMMLPQLQALTEAQLRNGDAVKVIAGLYGGAAAKDASTLNGALAQLKETLGEAGEALAKGMTGTNDMGGAVNSLRNHLVDAMPQIEQAGILLARIGSAGMEALGALDAMVEQGVLQTLFGGKREALSEPEVDGSTPQGQLTRLQQGRDEIRQQIAAAEARLAEVNSIARITPESKLSKTLEIKAEIESLQRSYENAGNVIDAYKSELKSLTPAERQAAAEAIITAGSFTKLAESAEKAKAPLTDLQKLLRETMQQGQSNTMLALTADDIEDPGTRMRVIGEQIAETARQIDKVREAALDGTMKPEVAKAMMAGLEASMSELGTMHGKLYLEALDKTIAAGPLSDAQIAANEMDAMSLDGEASTFQADAGTDAELAAEGTAAREHMLDLQQREHDLRLTIAEQGFATFEQESQLNDLIWEQAAALDGVITNEERLAHARDRKIKQAEHDAKTITTGQLLYRSFTGALTQTASAFVDMAIAGEISGKKLLQTMLQSLSQMAQQKMVEQLALAWAAIGSHGASGNPGAHFASAAMWGGLAIGAGVAAGAVGGGGGSEGGGGASSVGGDEGFNATRRAATEPAEPAGPRVNLTIQGSFVGTNMEDVTRHLETYLSESIRDSGGRSGSFRG
jgi:hypothetical protein